MVYGMSVGYSSNTSSSSDGVIEVIDCINIAALTTDQLFSGTQNVTVAVATIGAYSY